MQIFMFNVWASPGDSRCIMAISDIERMQLGIHHAYINSLDSSYRIISYHRIPRCVPVAFVTPVIGYGQLTALMMLHYLIWRTCAAKTRTILSLFKKR